jgi:hypothetical protein
MTPKQVERFWSKVAAASNGCWLWTGSRYSNGYGYFWLRRGRSALAHRVAYELAAGPIDEGMELDHLCRVRHCVNPAHLEAVTHRVNDLRGVGVSAINAAKTHCPAGHPLSGDNLYVARGKRQCRTCRRRHAQRSDARRRAERAGRRRCAS